MSVVNKIIVDAKKESRSVLSEIEAKEVLKDYGIPVIAGILAANEEETVFHAEKMGFPVVLKVVSPQVTHKSDAGGVKLNLKNAAEVKRAHQEIMAKVRESCPEAEIKGILVQPMALSGRELVVGAMQDPLFGPVVMFGLGGIFVEVLKDVAFRLAPINREEARDMIRQIKGYPVLEGVRGEPACDLEAIEEIIVKVSKLIYEQKETISEIDINPLFGYTKGVIAVDARMVLITE